jgi:hypothetical protein
MAEDSGAFKTNLRIRAGYRHNITIRRYAWRGCRTAEEADRRLPEPSLLIIARESLRVFSTWPDSQHLGGTEPANFVVTAFPDGSNGLRSIGLRGRNKRFMLPGFRFLFAAIVLSTSVLIFGLGAAALLRAAHEEVASIPSRRAPPEIMFAQPGDAVPTLAVLQVEPSAATETAAEPEKPAAEPGTLAASTDVATESTTPSETPKPEAAASELPVQAEAATDAPAAAVESKVAAIAEIAEAPSQTAVTAPEQASVPIDDSTRIAETKIATLGGPPVTIETQPPAKAASAVVRKSVQARRVVKRRRIAPARVTRQAPQTPADPFARPFGR